MAHAGLHFTSLVGGSVAPVILSWTPTEGGHRVFFSEERAGVVCISSRKGFNVLAGSLCFNIL